jgi:hypothetical protein
MALFCGHTGAQASEVEAAPDNRFNPMNAIPGRIFWEDVPGLAGLSRL